MKCILKLLVALSVVGAIAAAIALWCCCEEEEYISLDLDEQ